MSPFVRIKNSLINLESLAYVRVEENYIDFGFAFGFVCSADQPGGQNFLRFEKGSHLQEAEFEQVKDFFLQLPDPDRVLIL